MDSLAEEKVVCNERIEVLKEHYKKNDVSIQNVIVEKVPQEYCTSDSRAKWAIKQFHNAAVTVHVESFIVPLQKGGAELPVLASETVYINAFLVGFSDEIERLKSSILIRDGFENTVRIDMLQEERLLFSLSEEISSISANAAIIDEAGRDAREDILREKRAKVEQVKVNLKNYRAEWSKLTMDNSRDAARLSEIKNEAIKNGKKQRDADEDAVVRVRDALNAVKKVLLKLMELVPDIADVVRSTGEVGTDPFEIGDMRRCYANLLERYHDDDELGMLAVVLTGMSKKQDSRKLKEFWREMEMFNQDLVKTEIETVSRSDLVSMIALSNMTAADRKGFLEFKTTLKMTRKTLMKPSMDRDDLTVRGEGESFVSTGPEMPLIEQLRMYVSDRAKQSILNDQYGGDQGQKPAESKRGGASGDVRKQNPYQMALIDEMKKKGVKNGCTEYYKTGRCSREKCLFDHSVTLINAVKDESVNATKNESTPQADAKKITNTSSADSINQSDRRMMCFEYLSKGVCSRGSNCRFKHGPQGGTEKINSVLWSDMVFMIADEQAKLSGVEPCNSAELSSRGDGAMRCDREHETAVNVPVSSEPITALNGSVHVLSEPAESKCSVLAVSVCPDEYVLGWDTMSTVCIVNDASLIAEPVPIVGRRAVGLGGAKSITLRGRSDVFGVDACYIEGGGTPNLLSVGESLQRDASGLPGVAIFTSTGAIRMRADSEIESLLLKLLHEAKERKLVQGTAVMCDNVYVESFEKVTPRVGVGGSEDNSMVLFDKSGPLIYPLFLSMYAGRVKLKTTLVLMDMLAKAGLSKAALKSAVKNKNVVGLPPVVDNKLIDEYFNDIGKDVATMEADITFAPLVQPLGYMSDDVNAGPGEIMQVDAVEPSWAKMKVKTVKGTAVMELVPAIGGFKDAVIAVDRSGYLTVAGRITKAKPEVILEELIDEWEMRWPGKLRVVKADKEFVSSACVKLCTKHGIELRQSVPAEHSRNTGRVEGTARWIQDLGCMFMNQLVVHVDEHIIDERTRRSLWYHCLRMARMATLFRESLLNSKKTRWEEGFGEVLNLSYVVMLPFGMKVVGRNPKNDADGRGSLCLYLGPASLVRGGIITYNLKTRAVSVKYSFLPVNNVARPTNKNMSDMLSVMYGKPIAAPLQLHRIYEPVVEQTTPGKVVNDSSTSDVSVAESGGEIVEPSDVIDTHDGGEVNPVESQEVLDDSETLSESLNEASVNHSSSPVNARASSDVNVPKLNVSTSDDGKGEWTDVLAKKKTKKATKQVQRLAATNGRTVLSDKKSESVTVDDKSVVDKDTTAEKRQKKAEVISNYGLRTRKHFKSFAMFDEVEDDYVFTLDVEDRGKQPKVPPARLRRKMREWIDAYDAEVGKLKEEETFIDLPVVDGVIQVPPDAIILDLLAVCTYKWKIDPKDGRSKWIANVRLVANGKDEPADSNVYAECPDRTLYFLMLSVGAVVGDLYATLDAIRAYLNAMSVKRNIVIRARGIRGLPEYSLLSKGLYGTRSGAYSWQLWIEAILRDINFKKLDVARGVYLKKFDNSSALVRMLRHSDDFLIGCKDPELRDKAIAELRERVRMSDPVTPPDSFLGCTVEYLDERTGEPSPSGKIVCIRQSKKIAEMCDTFKHLHDLYNPKQRVRDIPICVSALASDDQLRNGGEMLLNPDEIKEYQSLVGSLGWISRARPDCRFAYLVLSQRATKPRKWDMYLAVWLMDFLSATRECPLVLGGESLETVVYSDASFASMKERRSVIGHCVMMSPKSGAICVNVSTTKCAVTNVFEAEILAASAAIDTALYVNHAAQEMQYPVESVSCVKCDNEAGIHWLHGSVSNKNSKHVDVHMYHAIHLVQSGDVIVEYVKSEDNIADILTKPMTFARFIVLARKILGHELLDGLNVPGVMKLSSGSIERKSERDAMRELSDEVYWVTLPVEECQS